MHERNDMQDMQGRTEIAGRSFTESLWIEFWMESVTVTGVTTCYTCLAD